jgi:UDP-2,3-diacylglucosamine pyrophosphatase LpxH
VVTPEPVSSNYLIFSDVHLGADLVQHVRPWTVSRLKQVARIDRDLASMLDFYRENRDPDRPWRLVIAGDLVDFIGMSIAPAASTPPADLTDEERLFGLGSTCEHAALKMRAVARRHGLVFQRLAAFVAEGHSLIIVRGNHDIDFYWETAQQAFVEALVECMPGLADDAVALERFRARIEFHGWFYYEEGLLYVEHGHQFDAMCSYDHPLAPLMPHDKRRLCWSFSDILLRAVARPTPGLTSEGHEKWKMHDYLRLAASLGLIGGFQLAYRYFSAVLRALRRWRSHLSHKTRDIRAEHERRLEEVARRARVGVDKLRAVAALWPAPVTRGMMRVLRSVHLDRIVIGGAIGMISAALVLMLPVEWWIPCACALVGAGVAYLVWSNRQRLLDLDPKQAMRKGAGRIAQLFDARFIVMGHTHDPLAERIDDRATYVNLGNWGIDDLDDAAHEDAPRTHLVLRWIDGQLRAEFCRWDRDRGPLPQPLPSGVSGSTGLG